MGSILSPAGLQFVNQVDYLQQSLTKIEGELSSGLAVQQASDAPDQVSSILQLHADIQQNTQIEKNLNSTQTNAQTADQSLSTASSILNQVATLASEGLGLNATSQTRLTLASQVGTLLQQMVSISNTAVSGNYIFSGDSAQNPSYSYNATTGTVQRLQIASATQQVQDGAGGTFATGLSANQIFDVRDGTDTAIPGQNVFAAISNVYSALKNNDAAGLQAAVGNVQTSSAYLSTQQAFYGNVETQVTSSLSNVNKLGLSYQADLSSRQDANETSAIIQMQQYTTTLQAALAAESKMPRNTLFDSM